MMKRSVLKVTGILFCVLLFGCAGKNFVRMTGEEFILGQTTYENIRARFGKPYREGVMTKNDRQIKTVSYAYANAGGQADTARVTPARSQGFYFFDNKLVGFEYTSSWKSDSTDFASDNVSKIKKGESTRAEVVNLFGNPGGKYIYPVIPNDGEEAVNYLYVQTKGSAFNLKFYQKMLVVTFNKEGMVTNIEFTESGQR